MSVHAYRVRRLSLLGSSALAALLALGAMASAQEQPAQNQPAQDQPVQSQIRAAATAGAVTAAAGNADAIGSRACDSGARSTAACRRWRQTMLPQITVTAPPVSRRRVRSSGARRPPPTVPPVTPAEQLTEKQNELRCGAQQSLHDVGTTSDTISSDTIQALPQGTNAPVERVILQAPGVSQDSAASGLFHVRNDHANVQFRINGVMLPDGVTGFGSVLDTDLIGSMSLDYRRAAGRIRDAHRRRSRHHHPHRHFQQFGQHQLLRRQPRHHRAELRIRRHGRRELPLDRGGARDGKPPSAACFGGVQYFVTGSYLQTTEGIENPLPTLNAIHDFSSQEKGFAYASTFIDPYTRLT